MLFNLKDIECKFDNKIVLKKLSLIINKGQHLLIHGDSGSGKTTLINLMAGLMRPVSGSITFEKKNYHDLTDADLDILRSKNFGFIFQRLHLIGHLNIEQNISIAKNKEDSQCYKKLIEDLGLGKMKTQKVRNLSVGEAQRVAIARGVVNNPKVIFADEPTSALDDVNATKVIDLILSQTKNTKATLIVSTHDHRIKKLFSNVIEL